LSLRVLSSVFRRAIRENPSVAAGVE